MKIVSLTASNVKRLRAVEIKPDGAVVVIGGRNEAGKTSVLDSIAAALGGAKLCPKVPIRTGETSAEAKVKLDNGLVITRRWTLSGSTLHVETKDGARYRKPQAMLDELVGRLTFDPLQFSRDEPRKQLATLQDLAGVDLTELEGQRAHAFDERKNAKRMLSAETARLEGMAHHEDAPAEPVSVDKLMEELERRRGVNDANERAGRQVESDTKRLTTELGVAQSREQTLAAEVAQLRQDLEAAEGELREAEQARVDAHASLEKMLREAEQALGSLVDEETDDLVAEIRGAEAVNRKVTDNAQRANQVDIVDDLAKTIQGMNEQIAYYDAERELAISTAKFPVDGLGLGEDGVTFNGLPLEQASGAQKLRISVAMGIALNPELRILLIRDGSLLDESSLAMVAQMAEDADAQVWIERVGEGGASVVIEDGAVAGVDVAEPEQQELVQG